MAVYRMPGWNRRETCPVQEQCQEADPEWNYNVGELGQLPGSVELRMNEASPREEQETPTPHQAKLLRVFVCRISAVDNKPDVQTSPCQFSKSVKPIPSSPRTLPRLWILAAYNDTSRTAVPGQ